MLKQVQLNTERFILRSIAEQDVTERYLLWLKDVDAKKYITTATQTKEIVSLKKYVCDRISCDDILFLCILDKNTGMHIGNIKYEPVNKKLGYAIMGILIGEPGYRGKGVTKEVIVESAQWLKEVCGIDEILLGVHRENYAAIRAYEKVGFVIKNTPHIRIVTSSDITMSWCIGE